MSNVANLIFWSNYNFSLFFSGKRSSATVTKSSHRTTACVAVSIFFLRIVALSQIDSFTTHKHRQRLVDHRLVSFRLS